MASQKKKKKKREVAEAELDMTPMIDVTFLLIIFFLCLEFKTLEGRLSANLPKDVGVNKSPAEPMEKLDIRITNVSWGTEVPAEHGSRFNLKNHVCRWKVGPTPVRSVQELQRLLEKEVKRLVVDPKDGKKKPKPITIKTGQGVTYSDVTYLIDVARHIGFEEVTFGGGEGTRKRPNAK